MNKPEYLTRSDAHQYVDDIYVDGTVAEMRKLAEHWNVAGHWNETLPREDWYYTLHEFVDQEADALRDTRSGRNPKDSDPTELTAPEAT